jgi:hypothetical protein
MGTKINQLIQQLPAGTILLSAWLNAEGYPYELQQKYRKSGWLTSVGTWRELLGSGLISTRIVKNLWS